MSKDLWEVLFEQFTDEQWQERERIRREQHDAIDAGEYSHKELEAGEPARVRQEDEAEAANNWAHETAQELCRRNGIDWETFPDYQQLVAEFEFC